MWHSTGANNPYLSRYIGPDDGILGVNKYNNHWNQPKPDGQNKCVHAFIGYTKDKKDVVVYQTLPWNHVGWHSGSGSRGSANTLGYVSFEMCEDGLNNKGYFDKVYQLGVELTAKILIDNNLPCSANTVMDHAEGHRKGIASNHGDVIHWLRKHGKSMDTVRSDVQKLMSAKKKEAEVVSKPEPKPHWAEVHFNNLNKKGIKVNEKRFDEPITRGELFALLDRLTDKEGK